MLFNWMTVVASYKSQMDSIQVSFLSQRQQTMSFGSVWVKMNAGPSFLPQYQKILYVCVCDVLQFELNHIHVYVNVLL